MVKNFLHILLTFLASANSVVAQRYDFDYYIHYDGNLNDNHLEFQRAYSFQNSDYCMRFDLSSDGTILAQIVDDNVIHTFQLNNVTFPLKSSDFKYLFSKKVKPSNKDRRKFKLLGTKDLDNNQKEYTVSVPLETCQIVVLPYDKDIVYSGLALTFDEVPKTLHKELFKDEKLAVLSSKCQFKDGSKHNLELKAFDPQVFSILILPQQLKYD